MFLQKQEKKGLDFSEETTIVPLLENGAKGRRSRPDMLVKNKDGSFTYVENKLFDTTNLSTGQRNAEKHIKEGSGKFEVRSTKQSQGLKPGDRIEITEFLRNDKYKKNP